jgi:hypothetical protein
MRLRLAATGLVLCACLWLAGEGFSVALARDSAVEPQLIKAAFIYNFAKFTRWPERAIEPGSTALTLCIAGEDDLSEVLDRLGGKLVKGHSLSVQPYKPGLRNCNMVYVAASEHKRLPELTKALSNQPVLTISELPGYARSGGIIELFRDDGRIRFIVNLASARTAGLEISPSLLSLATVIGQDPAP